MDPARLALLAVISLTATSWGVRPGKRAGQAGLHLAAVATFGALLRDHGSSLTVPGSSDWTWHEVTVPVGGEATGIRFAISLTGRGRIELRGAELTPARPGTQE